MSICKPVKSFGADSNRVYRSEALLLHCLFCSQPVIYFRKFYRIQHICFSLKHIFYSCYLTAVFLHIGIDLCYITDSIFLFASIFTSCLADFICLSLSYLTCLCLFLWAVCPCFYAINFAGSLKNNKESYPMP